MNWALIAYALSILAVVIVSGSLAEYSRRHRHTLGGGAFMWVSILVCLLALLDGLSLIGPTAAWALFWFDARFLSLAFIPVAWFAFVIEFTGQGRPITPLRLAILSIIPAATEILIWTNPLHGLWTNKPVGFHEAGGFFIAQTALRIPGPWFWIHLAYSYALIVAGLAVLAVMLKRIDRRDRGQVLAVGLGTVVMAFVSALPLTGLLRNVPFNLMAPGMAAGMLLFFGATYRYRFLRSPLSLREANRAPVALITLFVLLTGGIIATGYFYYRYHEKSYRLEMENTLSSIVNLKVDEMVQWRRERLADALVLHENSAFSNLVRRSMHAPVDAGAEARMRVWLSQLKSAYRYRNVVFVDAAGRVRYSVVAAAPGAYGEIQKLIPKLRQSGEIVFLDFYREDSAQISLSLVVPIEEEGRFLGAVALVVDPEEYLYPMIRRWPALSATAETLLVRREGEDVVFLNELRFQKGSALTLRFPLSQNDLPAARAARGEERVMTGIDYRGKPVIAALRTVPDSPWFMVARMDVDEIYAPILEHLVLMIFMVCVLISAVGAGAWLFWQRQRNAFYRRELASAAALQISEEKFRKAFMTSPDAVAIVRLSDGRIISVNPGFLQMTGYTREEVDDRVIGDLHLWDNQEEPAGILETLKTDEVVMNREVRFHKKDGSMFYGLVSGSLIEFNGENHILSITRDITQRKQAENDLQKANERLRRFHDSNIVGTVIAAADGSIVEANDYYLKMIGFSREEFAAGQIDWRALTPPEWLPADEKAIAEVRRMGACIPYEKQYLRRDQTRVDVFLAVAGLPGENEQLAAFVLDITERKMVEREVLRLNEELEARVTERTAELTVRKNELERLNKIFVGRELRMRELKQKMAASEKL